MARSVASRREGPRSLSGIAGPSGAPPLDFSSLFSCRSLHSPFSPGHATEHGARFPYSHASPCTNPRAPQDLLTQPFAHQLSTPSRPAPADLTSTSHEGGRNVDRQPSIDDRTSIATTSTSDAVQQSAANFSQLRTAPASAAGLPNEPRVEAPSVVKGDWRVYGHVKAQCIFWNEGALAQKGLGSNWRKEREKLADVHEWVADGTLWITKASLPSRLIDCL